MATGQAKAVAPAPVLVIDAAAAINPIVLVVISGSP
jgi:hypothetical protein